MKLRKKKVFGSALITSLILLGFAVLKTTSATASVASERPGPPGTYEIDILGDGSVLSVLCEMIHHFKARDLGWSTSIPSYPGQVDFALDVRNVDFDKPNAWTYHLSVRGLKDGLIFISSYSNFILSVRARSGEIDFAFSNQYQYPYPPYYYRNATITGTLKGDVLFHIFSDGSPSIPEFHFEGSELTIRVHIGM